MQGKIGYAAHVRVKKTAKICKFSLLFLKVSPRMKEENIKIS